MNIDQPAGHEIVGVEEAKTLKKNETSSPPQSFDESAAKVSQFAISAAVMGIDNFVVDIVTIKFEEVIIEPLDSFSHDD